MQSLLCRFSLTFIHRFKIFIVYPYFVLFFSLLIPTYSFSINAQNDSDFSSDKLSLNEGYFFAQNSNSTLDSNLELNNKNIDLILHTLTDFVSDPDFKKKVNDYLQAHPLDPSILPEESELQNHFQAANNFKRAHRLYKTSLDYIANQKEKYRQEEYQEYLQSKSLDSDSDSDSVSSDDTQNTSDSKNSLIVSKHDYIYTDHEFLDHLKKKLFIYHDPNSKSSVHFTIINGVVLASVFLDDESSTVYNFFVFDPMTHIDQYENDSDLKNKINEFNKLLKKLNSKQHMERLNVVNARLDDSYNILGLEHDNYPTFKKDPLRYLSEFSRSIFEKPQISVGLFCTALQLSIYLGIKYLQNSNYFENISSFRAALPLLHIAFFALVISTNAGTYRNLIDFSKKYYVRFIIDTIIGLSFAYPLIIYDDTKGIAALSLLTLSGWLEHIRLISVTYIHKATKYPITYIIRMLDKFGYYGQNGERMTQKFFGIQFKRKNLDNQLLYNMVSFGLKMGALLGVSMSIPEFSIPLTSINMPEIELPIGSMLFLGVPLIAVSVNNLWIKNQYKKALIQYYSKPSEALKVDLARKQEGLKDHLKYLKKIFTILYSIRGFFTGTSFLDSKREEILSSYKISLDNFKSLTKKQLKKMSISQLSEVISFYESVEKDILKEMSPLSKKDISDIRELLATAKIIRLQKIYKLRTINAAKKVLTGKTLPDKLSQVFSCKSLFLI